MHEHRQQPDGHEFLLWRFDLSVEDRLVADFSSDLVARVMRPAEFQKYEAGLSCRYTGGVAPSGVRLLNHGGGVGEHFVVVEKLTPSRSALSSAGSVAGPLPGLGRVEKRPVKRWQLDGVGRDDEVHIINTAPVNARVMTWPESRDYMVGEPFHYCGGLLEPGHWRLNRGGRDGDLVVACDRIPLGPGDGSFRFCGGGDVARDVTVKLYQKSIDCWLVFQPSDISDFIEF